MEIYYQSATNQIINLKSPNYRLQTANVFNYEWEYESNQSTSYGGKITKFTKAISKKKLILTVSGKTKSEYYDAMNNFFAITEKDVVELTLGRLYVNGYYCECYITECQKSEWESGCPLCETEITLVTPYPFFISETKQEYAIQEITGEYGQFPMKYPTRYASWSTNQTLINPHFSTSPFKLILYGECTNPSVLINGILYKVNTVVGANEYITIDTKAKTIYLTRIDGAQVNLYNLQDREFYIFTPIPAGQNTISWDGSFPMEIIIFEERGEPKWM